MLSLFGVIGSCPCTRLACRISPLKARPPVPREVAQVIAFLCSDAAGGMNGEAITVALGGMW